MSRIGRCIDNGPMEGYWGILKSEMYYLKKFTSKVELTEAIEAYIAYYNTKRYQFRLHCMTPMEYHKRLCGRGLGALREIYIFPQKRVSTA